MRNDDGLTVCDCTCGEPCGRRSLDRETEWGDIPANDCGHDFCEYCYDRGHIEKGYCGACEHPTPAPGWERQ